MIALPFTSEVPFSPRLQALLDEPATWESLACADRRHVVDDFLELQSTAVAEHTECKNRLDQFCDQVYLIAQVTI